MLSLQPDRTNGNLSVVEVEEVRALAARSLRVLPSHTIHDHDIWFDFSVRVISITCVSPALACKPHIFVDRKLASHKKIAAQPSVGLSSNQAAATKRSSLSVTSANLQPSEFVCRKSVAKALSPILCTVQFTGQNETL